LIYELRFGIYDLTTQKQNFLTIRARSDTISAEADGRSDG